MTNTHKIIFTLMVIAATLIYLILKEETSNKVISIAPIEIPQQTLQKEEVQEETPLEILAQLETATTSSRKIMAEQEIAQNVLEALEKNLHKPLPVVEVKEPKKEEEAQLTVTVETPVIQEIKKVEEKPIKPSPSIAKVEEPVKIKVATVKQQIEKTTTPSATTHEKETKPKIMLISQKSHASLTHVNTLIEDTHPEAKLQIYNGTKAYVLDESAETEGISMDQEEFESLPWSQTYGVVEESESFELQEEAL